MSHATVKLIRNTQPVRLMRPIKTVTLARVAGGPKGDPGTDTSLLVAKGDVLTHDGIDAVRLGVGTDGQQLTADSVAGEGISWQDPVTGALTTIGDLLGYDGSTTRFPVGADNAVLVADSGQAFGFRWGALPAASLPLHAATHENGGSDEISVLGLSGLLADAQTPLAHAASHLPSGTDPLVTAIAGTIVPDAAPAIGVAESFARSDHAHGFDTATPDALAVGAVAAEGAAINMVRRDHTHGVPSAAPGATVNAGDAAVEGVATSFVRSDHQHAVATAVAVGIDADTSNAEGVSTSLARADHTHDLPTAVAGTIEPDDAAAEGVSASLARADHQHAIVAAVAVELTDAANAEGVATSFARSDHTHAHGARGGGTLHAVATAILAGFMSAADKAAHDAHLIDFTNPHQVTQQQTYDQASDITLTAAQGAVTITDNATPVGNLWEVRDNSPDVVLAVAPQRMDWGPSARRVWSFNDDPTSYGAAEFMPDGGMLTTVPALTGAFVWVSTITGAIPGGGGIGNEQAPNFVTWAGEFIVTEQGNLFNTQSLFNQASTITCQGANTGPIYTMINQPLFRTGSTGGARTGSQQNAVRSQVRIGPNIAGSFILPSHEAFFATAILNASVGGASITTCNYFAPKAPSFTGGATIGTLNCMDIPDIPAAGITSLRGINSAMASGFFIFHTGIAPSFYAGELRMGDAVPVRFGADPGAGVEVSRSSAGVLRLIGDGGTNDEGIDLDFDGTADVVELSSSTGAGLKISPSGAANAAASIVLGDGLDPDGTANWWLGWSPGARTVNLAGDWFDVLFSPGANVDLDGNAMGTVATMELVEPGITLSGGSVVTAATLLIANAPTEGSTNNNALRVGAGLTSLDDLETRSGSLVGFYGATPVVQSAAYTRNAAIVEDRTLLASASATTLNNNNVLAALIADLQAIGIIA